VSVSITTREYSIQSKIRQLQGVLPYPLSWYLGKDDKEINGIHRQHLVKIATAAIAYDDMLVRRKAGLC
jgi:hypothetical protein